MKIATEFEYIGFYDLNDITDIRSTKEKGHIQIKFIEQKNRTEYSVNLYKIEDSRNEYRGSFISHYIDTKEEHSSGSADCKLIKDENEYYLIGNWTEDSNRYGWTFAITKETS